MAQAYRCSIVTPSKAVFDDRIAYASIPAWDGQMGFLAGGSPVLVKLGVGPLRLDFPGGGSRTYLVDGGFAEFHEGDLTILSDGALPAEEISLSDAEAELSEANARVTQDVKDRERVERDQRRAMAKVAIAKGHAGRGGGI